MTNVNRATRRKAARTKIPARKVDCGDLEIVSGGKTYNPHAGETVTFAGGAFLNSLVVAMDLGSLANLDTDNPDMDQIVMLKEKLEAAADQVAGLVQSWTWTDDTGERYPDPPTPEVLKGLRFEELAYLATASMGDLERPDDDRKNGSTP